MTQEPDYSADFFGVLAILRRLRDPERGCPWDIEQTPRTLVPHLIEEAHEAADAIESGERGAIIDELGDLMLHLAFQIVIAEEDNSFDLANVAGNIIDKMVRRHPHVFGSAEYAGTAHQAVWETLKRRERDPADERRDSVIGTLPESLPALVRAYRIQQKVATIGFDGGPPMALAPRSTRSWQKRPPPPRQGYPSHSRKSLVTCSSRWSTGAGCSTSIRTPPFSTPTASSRHDFSVSKH